MIDLPRSVRRDDIIGKPILITSYDKKPSKYKGEYAIVYAKLDETEITFIGNEYMLRQLKQVKNFPVLAKVIRRDKGPYIRFIDFRGI